MTPIDKEALLQTINDALVRYDSNLQSEVDDCEFRDCSPSELRGLEKGFRASEAAFDALNQLRQHILHLEANQYPDGWPVFVLTREHLMERGHDASKLSDKEMQDVADSLGSTAFGDYLADYLDGLLRRYPDVYYGLTEKEDNEESEDDDART